MDNEKYYIAKVEDYDSSMGYDFLNTNTGEWTSVSGGMGNIFFMDRLIHNPIGCVRVKYLDKEDIESLGWTPHLNRSTESYWIKKADISFYLDVNEFYIHIGMGLLESIKNIKLPRTTFYGTIKNKSELKKIMQQIGIL